MTDEEAMVYRDLLRESAKGCAIGFKNPSTSSARFSQQRKYKSLTKETDISSFHISDSANPTFLAEDFASESGKSMRRKRYRAEHWEHKAAILLRDNGRCAKCGLETLDLFAAIRLCHLKFDLYKPGWGTALSASGSLFNLKKAIGFRAYRYPCPLWDVDRIIPKCLGGIDDLSNLRTLCLECHRSETNRLVYRKEC